MAFDESSPQVEDDVTEVSGKLGLTEIGKGLMHSVLDADKKNQDGKLIKEAIDQGAGSFVPDDLFERFVQNYKHSETMYGKTFINLVSGFDSDYVGRNVKIPEFQRELKKKILEKVEDLKSQGLLDNDYIITEKGMQLASLVLYVEELDELASKTLVGERTTKKRATYGAKGDTHVYKKGDRFRDIALKRSIKRALRRNHKTLHVNDLETYERKKHGAVYVLYGLDASGSMKGQKITVAKKAGVALAFSAIERKDKVGVIVFSNEIKEEISPTNNFGLLLRTITGVKATHQTDIVKLIHKAIELFPKEDATKHLILLSDALPTAGKNPEEETINAVSIAREHGITISIVGINLDKSGENLAKKIAEIGDGRFYLVRDVENLDAIVLDDYYHLE